MRRGERKPGKAKIGDFPPPLNHHYTKNPPILSPFVLSHATVGASCLPNAVPVSSCPRPWRVPIRLSGVLEEGIRLNKESSGPRPHPPGFLQPQRRLLLSLYGGFLIAQRAPGLCPWPFSLASQYIHTILVTPSSLVALNTIDMKMVQ